jgi:hypothetical protein
MAFWETLSSHHRTGAQRPQTYLASTQALRSWRVSSALKSPNYVVAHRSDQCSSPVRPVRPVRCSCTSVFGLQSWLCGSAKEPSGFLVNHQKPRELGVASDNLHSWLGSHVVPARPWFWAQPRNRPWLHLAVLAIMRPALVPVGHRVPQTKPTCILHTWRPHQQRPFTLVLHLHQH